MVPFTTAPADVHSNPIAFETIEKFRYGSLVGINRGAILQLGNQLGTFDLRFTFRAFKTVPAALSPASYRIMVIKNDRPNGRVNARGCGPALFPPLLFDPSETLALLDNERLARLAKVLGVQSTKFSKIAT